MFESPKNPFTGLLKQAHTTTIDHSERLEKRYDELIQAALEELRDFEDNQRIVLEDEDSSGYECSVAEARHLAQTMRNPQNPFTQGRPTPFFVLSTDPDAFFLDREKELRQKKQYARQLFDPYEDDRLITYVFQNHYTDSKTGNALYYQKTAGELRAWIDQMDYAELDNYLNSDGGIGIISADPNITLEDLEAQTPPLEDRIPSASFTIDPEE